MLKIKRKIVNKKFFYKIAAICFWLLFWEFLSRFIGQQILVASPIQVFMTLLEFFQTGDFWRTIISSSGRIILGFFLALGIGLALAILSYRYIWIKELVAPLIKVIKSIPVASFIILALIWVKGRYLSILISFLILVPMIYTNVLQGLTLTDKKLLQMAEIFRLSLIKKIYAIYIPSVLPHFMSAISVGMGFCWKAGIAAEVIGIPKGSIGVKLYEAKLYLMTKELFAWTIVIIGISIFFERFVTWLIRKLSNSIWKGEAHGYQSRSIE